MYMSVHVYVSSLIGPAGQLGKSEKKPTDATFTYVTARQSTMEVLSCLSLSLNVISILLVSHLSGGSFFLSLLLLAARRSQQKQQVKDEEEEVPSRALFIGITFVHSLSPIMRMTFGGV